MGSPLKPLIAALMQLEIDLDPALSFPIPLYFTSILLKRALHELTYITDNINGSQIHNTTKSL